MAAYCRLEGAKSWFNAAGRAYLNEAHNATTTTFRVDRTHSLTGANVCTRLCANLFPGLCVLLTGRARERQALPRGCEEEGSGE